MNIETLSSFFLWCFIINVGILLYWFAFIALARGFVYRLHSRWFKISEEQFNAIHYTMIGAFKIFIFVFNLVPYIALQIVG